MRYLWDETKRRSNLAKHGLDFADADLVLDNARAVTGLADDDLLAPVSDRVPVTLAELVFGVTHEGAHDVADLLDRRTRVGLVSEDREAAEPLARRALSVTEPAAR
jgi:glycerol-3-phosphate dehydrogenase